MKLLLPALPLPLLLLLPLPPPPSLHDRRTPTRFGCGGTRDTTLTSLAVLLLFPKAPEEGPERAEAEAEAETVVVDVLGGGRTDFLTAKRVPEPRCRASHTSDSSERPMTRSKSKAREKAKVSGARREGEGSRSVAEEAVTWR